MKCIIKNRLHLHFYVMGSVNVIIVSYYLKMGLHIKGNNKKFGSSF